MMNTETRHRQKLPVAAFENAADQAVHSGEKQVTVREAAALYAGRFEYLRTDLGWTWRAITDYFTEHTNHPIGKQTLRNYHSELLKPTEQNPSNEVLVARAQVAREVAEIRERQAASEPASTAPFVSQPRAVDRQPVAAAVRLESPAASRSTLPIAPATVSDRLVPDAAPQPQPAAGEWSEITAVAEAIKQVIRSGEPRGRLLEYTLADGSTKKTFLDVEVQEGVLEGHFDTLDQAKRANRANKR